MDSVELVKQMCKERHIPISKLERDLNFSNGYIRKLKEGKFPSDRLQKIADYFGVTLEYLMTGEQKEDYYLTEETAAIAQQIFDDRDLRALFDAAQGSRPEDLKMAKAFLERLKGTNPDG